MKKLKVSIQDENTLILQEDGHRGDLIDLTTLHDTDIDKSTISNVVNSIKKDAFNAEVQKVSENIEREKSLEMRLKEQELLERMKILEQEKESAAKLAEANAKNVMQADITKKEAEIAELKAAKELELSRLASQKDNELAELKARLQAIETEKKLAVTEAVTKVEKERDELSSELKSKEAERLLQQSSLRDKYETQLKDRDDTIERLKDMKSKLSVKLLGENLEQHCQNEFNSVRSSMFPFAYFEKDNEAIKEDDETKGTKGDYIYRDYESNGGAEIVSIMFEMKDEQDVSSNKRTIESHLDKLDKDRKKKGLEYAVLVTLLEGDNDFYNRGIVDVSYKYDKMFVVRPQFFLPLISLLKNANMKSADDRRQLAVAKNSNIDITNFENDLQTFQDDFMKNVKNSSSKFQEAMDGIDTTIKKLESVKEALRLSNKHLLTAGGKVENVSVKRLTKDNPTMAAKFAELIDAD